MLISIRSTATYELPAESFVLLMIEPHPQAPDHRVKAANLAITPVSFNTQGKDSVGNLIRRVVAPKGLFGYEYTATFETVANDLVPAEAVEHPAKDLPPETLLYTLPSRYCQSDLLSRMAQSEFGALPPGGQRVRAVAEWVRKHVEYRYGTTTSKTSAYDTATERVGVCRDFAHLVISFCRGTGAACPLRLGLRAGVGAARLPRHRPGLPWRALVQRRRDLRGHAPRPRADRRGPRRRRRGDRDLLGQRRPARAGGRGPAGLMVAGSSPPGTLPSNPPKSQTPVPPSPDRSDHEGAVPAGTGPSLFGCRGLVVLSSKPIALSSPSLVLGLTGQVRGWRFKADRRGGSGWLAENAGWPLGARWA